MKTVKFYTLDGQPIILAPVKKRQTQRPNKHDANIRYGLC